VIPEDAPVPGDTSLLRRVHPSEIVWDDNDGCPRPGSGVFKDPEMSVHLGDVLQDEDRAPETVLAGKPTYSLVSLTAAFVESEQQEVRRRPIDEDQSHGEVCGEKPRGRCRLFARTAEFVVLETNSLKPEVLAKMQSAAADGEDAAPAA
jgi:hypothetical protein